MVVKLCAPASVHRRWLPLRGAEWLPTRWAEFAFDGKADAAVKLCVLRSIASGCPFAELGLALSRWADLVRGVVACLRRRIDCGFSSCALMTTLVVTPAARARRVA